MTTSRPDVDPDGYYNITQAAKALGVERHSIYRYAEQGSIRLNVRKCNSRKVAKGSEIIRCWQKMYI